MRVPPNLLKLPGGQPAQFAGLSGFRPLQNQGPANQTYSQPAFGSGGSGQGKLYKESFRIKPTRDRFKKWIPGSGIGIGILTIINPAVGLPLAALWGLASFKAIRDMSQTEHSLLRTHPLIGHGRYILEGLRSEIQQYFIEKDTDEVPLSRLQRDLVYKRSKGVNDKQAFGTLHDLYKPGTEWLAHSMSPTQGAEIAPEPRIRIGGPECTQPYEASVFNTSGMSFGALSPQAVMALAKGAFADNFFVNTGEGGISPFHLGFDVNIEDKNFDFDQLLDIAKNDPLTRDKVAQLRGNERGILEKGLIKLLPLTPEEQLEAIRAGEDEGLRARIREGLAQIEAEILLPAGTDAEQMEQVVFEAYKSLQGGKIRKLPPAVAQLVNPVAAYIAVQDMKRMKAEESRHLEGGAQGQSLPLASEPALPTLVGPAKVLYTLIQQDLNKQQRLVSQTEQVEINEEILVRGLSKLFRIKNPERLRRGVAGKIVKGTAEKLRLNTMQFTRFPSGDLVWNIGTGYFGCRNPDGTFNPDLFAKKAQLPQVKMIELKLSQGAKPGGGGILPASKVTPGIAKLRGVNPGEDCVSPARHSAFSNPMEMMQFIRKLRKLSGGKPVGIKLCIGEPYEFLALCKAMRETGITPDFITVDGAEGGTGAAPQTMSDHVGMPLDDALSFVHNALIGAGLRNRVKIIASGKVVDEFDIISKMARGADACNSARAMMLSIGCIMARLCHTGECPVGVATQNPELTAGLDPNDKGLRNANYHRITIQELRHLLGAAGLRNTTEITPDHLMQRLDRNQVRRLSHVLPTLKPGALLSGDLPAQMPKHLQDMQEEWEAADPHSFQPKPGSRIARRMAESRDLRTGADYDQFPLPVPQDPPETPVEAEQP